MYSGTSLSQTHTPGTKWSVLIKEVSLFQGHFWAYYNNMYMFMYMYTRTYLDDVTQKLTFVVSLFHFPLLEALAAASRVPRRCNSLTINKAQCTCKTTQYNHFQAQLQCTCKTIHWQCNVRTYTRKVEAIGACQQKEHEHPKAKPLYTKHDHSNLRLLLGQVGKGKQRSERSHHNSYKYLLLPWHHNIH